MHARGALLGTKGVIALPGYFIADTPWAGIINESLISRTQGSAKLSGGHARGPGVQSGNKLAWDRWFDDGTYKAACVFGKDSDEGICQFYFGTTSQGSIDMYAAAASDNNFTEITAIVVTKGIKALGLVADSKNASSTGFHVQPQTLAWARTGA